MKYSLKTYRWQNITTTYISIFCHVKNTSFNVFFIGVLRDMKFYFLISEAKVFESQSQAAFCFLWYDLPRRHSCFFFLTYRTILIISELHIHLFKKIYGNNQVRKCHLIFSETSGVFLCIVSIFIVIFIFTPLNKLILRPEVEVPQLAGCSVLRTVRLFSLKENLVSQLSPLLVKVTLWEFAPYNKSLHCWTEAGSHWLADRHHHTPPSLISAGSSSCQWAETPHGNSLADSWVKKVTFALSSLLT